MKYYAISWYDDEIWVEAAEAKDGDEAMEKLGRNNPQLVITKEEFEKIKSEIEKIDKKEK